MAVSFSRGTKLIGAGIFAPVIAGLVMGYYTIRVIVWPDAFFEAAIVVPLAFLVLWRFMRVGVWLKDGQLVSRNAWETIRAPIDEVIVRKGYVDDISEFDRFTGGQANVMRAKAGDSFADRRFLRYRFLIDGEEHEIDAFVGRMPKTQHRLAHRLAKFVPMEEINHAPPA